MKEEHGATLRMRAVAAEQTEGPDAQEVLAYLARHPDFLLRHESILAELELPHRTGSAVSLVERQVALLRQRNIDSRQRLARLLETARENDELFTKTRQLILAVLECDSIERLTHVLLTGIRRDFGVEHGRLLLIGEAEDDRHGDGRIPLAVAESSLGGLLRQERPVAGPLRPQARAALFGERADEVHSAVVVSVGRTQPVAILALGSSDARRFHGEMGTMFMEFIGDVLQRLLPRFAGQQ